MGRRKETAAAIDALLKIIAIGGTITIALVAPNALGTLEKPLQKFFRHMDQRSRERELSRLKSYMKSQRLITDGYEHGMVIDKAGMKRLKQIQYKTITIKRHGKWDTRWRLLLFDIPQNKWRQRANFIKKLKSLDFQLLQQSAWIHPFSCRDEVYAIATHWKLDKYITYIETSHIDNEAKLIKRFQKLL